MSSDCRGLSKKLHRHHCTQIAKKASKKGSMLLLLSGENYVLYARSAWETRREMPPKVCKHRNQRYRIIKRERLLRTGRHGDSCQQQPKSKEEDKLGKQGGSGRELSEKGDKLGIQGRCSQEQLKKEIKEEGEKLARQGGSYGQEKPKRGIKKEDRLGSYKVNGKSRRETSLGDKAACSQEQPRREIMKGTSLGDKAAKSSPEGKSRRDTNLGDKAAVGSQEQPGREIMKGDKLGRQGGSDIMTIWRFRKSATHWK